MFKSSEETDADAVVEAQRAEVIAKQRKAGRDGELVGGPRRQKIRIGSIDPRNAVEQLFKKEYGTVTPVPAATARRAQKTISACIMHIHYNTPIDQIARILKMDATRLKNIKRFDEWDEFSQQLLQMNKPSSLALIPQHDAKVLETEMVRRNSKLEELRARDEELLAALSEALPASRDESSILQNIKKVRDLIDEVIGLADYKKEVSAARGIALKARALNAATDDLQDKGPRQADGQIIDLNPTNKPNEK